MTDVWIFIGIIFVSLAFCLVVPIAGGPWFEMFRK
jgi:hypothetical protein